MKLASIVETRYLLGPGQLHPGNVEEHGGGCVEGFMGQAWKRRRSLLPTFPWKEPSCKEIWEMSSSDVTKGKTKVWWRASFLFLPHTADLTNIF